MTNPVRRLFASALAFVKSQPPNGLTISQDVNAMDDTTLFVAVALSLLFYYLQGNDSGSGIVANIGHAAPPVTTRPPATFGGSGDHSDRASLPAGYDTDTNVAFSMFMDAMNSAGLNAVDVQGRGFLMVNALKARFPGLDVYVHPASDALMWPGFGSLDVTIDSGLGGFYFRPDGQGRFGEGR